MVEFVGRAEPLGRLVAAHRAVADAATSTPAPATGLVLVTGEAGIGKTALLRRFAAEADRTGATVVWGRCWDGQQAPAWWPWTEALRALIQLRPELDVPAEVAPLLSGARTTGTPAVPVDPSGRVRLLDAIATMLSRAAADRSVVVILDDLQWSDPSTLDLVSFLVRRPGAGGLLLVGAYRQAAARPEVVSGLAELVMSAELVPLQSLSEAEVSGLVASIAGTDAAARWGGTVHARSAGHPFFARELCRALAAGEDPTTVPPAVRDVIRYRLASVSDACQSLVGVAAVVGSGATPDLLAAATGRAEPDIVELVEEAGDAGIVVREATGVLFAHDLYREGALDAVPPGDRAELHHRLTRVLEDRRTRGIPVLAGDLARHAVAAIPIIPADEALAWAYEAAASEEARYAFAEAARHLARVAAAVAETGAELPAGSLVRLEVTEADLLLKAGHVRQAQGVLDVAWSRASRLADADLMGTVALGLDRCGARFAMPREQLIGVLEAARAALVGQGGPAAAQVTAALARQLQHSVPGDRPRAKPLAEEAVALARDLDDAATLASCLLAQHDSLWTPGTAIRRVEIAREITSLTRSHDREGLAQGLLLTANAQLESASPAFRATLREYAEVTRGLRQPRHDYLLSTRQAALALLDGDIDLGERLSAEAVVLGDAVGDTDTGNVRMSQRLEVVRARGRPEELREMAALAIEWWVGAPAYAHAIAAGFLARAGDLDEARHEVDTVVSLDEWRTDRSYLWSILVGELATAAIALEDQGLCRRLVDDIRPLRSTCAVNGALVCFMGAHAHRLGRLYAALDDRREARVLFGEALAIHERLGARVWAAETAAELALLTEDGPGLRPVGDLWEIGYRGHSATVRDCKGLRDLAVLVGRPGVDVPALELVAGTPVSKETSDQVLDRAALAAYRRRIAELEEELDDARAAQDLARAGRATDERELLLAELRRSTRPGGSARTLGARDSERARKAVSARIRDAIDRIEAVHPELAGHLDRSISTGSACRYEPREG